MKFNSLEIVLVLLVCFISGCRYEDGPAISFRSVENRLKGEYNIDKFEKGGIDLTDSLKKMSCYNKFIIHKSGDFEANQNPPCGCYGNYGLFENKTKIGFHFIYPDTLLEPLGGRFQNIVWDIVRLTDDEIHLTVKYNDQFIKFDLKE